MPRYSEERKEAVLRKMLPPHNRPLSELAAEEGISEATLYNWRRQARAQGRLLPDADTGPQGWSAADKFAAVVETAALNEAELGADRRNDRNTAHGVRDSGRYRRYPYRCAGIHPLVRGRLSDRRDRRKTV